MFWYTLYVEVEVFRLKLNFFFEVEVDVGKLFRHFGIHVRVLYDLSEWSEHA